MYDRQCLTFFLIFKLSINIGKIGPDPWDHILDASCWLEQSWKKVTKETVLLNYIAIGPLISGKKISKVFCIDI